MEVLPLPLTRVEKVKALEVIQIHSLTAALGVSNALLESLVKNATKNYRMKDLLLKKNKG